MYQLTVKHTLIVLIIVTAVLGLTTTAALTSLIEEKRLNNITMDACVIAVSNVTTEANQNLYVANLTINSLIKSYDKYQRTVITRDVSIGERICDLLGYGDNYTYPMDSDVQKIVSIKSYYGLLTPDSRYVMCYTGEYWDMRNWWQELLNVSSNQVPPADIITLV